jgi:predicted dithiol-disulfide oxidoreductase (DUF899 family)
MSYFVDDENQIELATVKGNNVNISYVSRFPLHKQVQRRFNVGWTPSSRHTFYVDLTLQRFTPGQRST